MTTIQQVCPQVKREQTYIKLLFQSTTVHGKKLFLKTFVLVVLTAKQRVFLLAEQSTVINMDYITVANNGYRRNRLGGAQQLVYMLSGLSSCCQYGLHRSSQQWLSSQRTGKTEKKTLLSPDSLIICYKTFVCDSLFHIEGRRSTYLHSM